MWLNVVMYLCVIPKAKSSADEQTTFILPEQTFGF